MGGVIPRGTHQLDLGIPPKKNPLSKIISEAGRPVELKAVKQLLLSEQLCSGKFGQKSSFSSRDSHGRVQCLCRLNLLHENDSTNKNRGEEGLWGIKQIKT